MSGSGPDYTQKCCTRASVSCTRRCIAILFLIELFCWPIEHSTILVQIEQQDVVVSAFLSPFHVQWFLSTCMDDVMGNGMLLLYYSHRVFVICA